MNRLQPMRFYIGLLGFFMAALVAGSFYFLIGISENSYVISDGVRLGMQYINKPRYDSNIQGFIYTISFLVAGGLMLLLIIIPDQEQTSRRRGDIEPPQPRRRGSGTQPEPVAESAPAPASSSMGAEESTTTIGQGTPVSIEAYEREGAIMDADEEAPPPPTRERISLEDEVLKSSKADLPELDLAESIYDESGDEDVVYGNGRVSEDSAWEFVQQYPDSAVKFLYRKTLDNKPLPPADDDIYRHWEARGLTRAMVREIVLELMGWHSLPDAFPHNIWREVRDQIYEMSNR